jgi:hypothetical protein
MPIQINEVETNVDVETTAAAAEGSRRQSAPESLRRWEELARRSAELAERTAARGFDD